MLGILLQRRPCPVEIVSDANGQIVNWWRMVRDHPAELGRLCDLTPISRSEYDAAYHVVTRPVGESHSARLEAARAVTIQLTQGLVAGLTDLSSWHHSAARMLSWSDDLFAAKFAVLAHRMRRVALETRDATETIKQHKTKPDAVIYCDPPYPDTEDLYAPSFDEDEFLNELLSDDVQAAIAVSGYAGAWPALTEAGWRKETRNIKQAQRHLESRTGNARTEVLWCNFEPVAQQPALL